MKLTLLIGDRHSGKTTACRQLADAARAGARTVGGIIAPAVHAQQSCIGYDVVDLDTNRGTRLACLDGPGVEQVGPFHFLADGLALGRAALERAADTPPDLVIVDEVGPLELRGAGWAAQLDQLCEHAGTVVFAVRRSLATTVAERWSSSSCSRHDVAEGTDAIIAAILRSL